MKLEAHLVVAELAIRQPRRLDGVFAFLDELLRRAPVIVKDDNPTSTLPPAKQPGTIKPLLTFQQPARLISGSHLDAKRNDESLNPRRHLQESEPPNGVGSRKPRASITRTLAFKIMQHRTIAARYVGSKPGRDCRDHRLKRLLPIEFQFYCP